MKIKCIFIVAFFIIPIGVFGKFLIGTFYFDGWAGSSALSIPNVSNPPTHLTEQLATTYKSRMPIWGWRDDNVTIMEEQIDLAAKNGIDFLVFCWYWFDDNSFLNVDRIESDPLNTSLRLFLKARNRSKMKFALLIANHQGHRIQGKNNWENAIEYLSNKYFHSPQYLKVEGKPLLVIFSPDDVSPYIPYIRDVVDKDNNKGLYLVSCYSKPQGFDMMTWYNIRLPEHGYPEKHTYKELVDIAEKGWRTFPKTENLAPLVMAGWDTRPWWNSFCRPGVYCVDRTPLLFKGHMKNAIKLVSRRPEKNKIIFIYAWNELGEGGYLIPTNEDPNGKYLKMIKQARKETRQ